MIDIVAILKEVIALENARACEATDIIVFSS